MYIMLNYSLERNIIRCSSELLTSKQLIISSNVCVIFSLYIFIKCNMYFSILQPFHMGRIKIREKHFVI